MNLPMFALGGVAMAAAIAGKMMPDVTGNELMTYGPWVAAGALGLPLLYKLSKGAWRGYKFVARNADRAFGFFLALTTGALGPVAAETAFAQGGFGPGVGATFLLTSLFGFGVYRLFGKKPAPTPPEPIQTPVDDLAIRIDERKRLRATLVQLRDRHLSPNSNPQTFKRVCDIIDRLPR